MAALAIPLVTTLLPTAIPLLVRLVDKLFGNHTGPAKLAAVSSTVQTLANGLAQVGQAAPGQVPDLPAITQQVQAVVDQLNAAGQLQGSATVIAPAIASGSVTDGLAGLQMMLTGYLKVTAALGAAK